MQASDDLQRASETTVPRKSQTGFGNDFKSLLERTYGIRFTVLDAATGETIESSPEQLQCDWPSRLDVCQTVVRRGTPEFLDDEDPLVTLAVPTIDAKGNPTLAVTAFLTRPVAANEDLSGVAQSLGLRADAVLHWARSQTPCCDDTLQQITTLVFKHARTRDRLQAIEAEAGRLSINLASTYEELDLLHRLTENLKQSKSEEQLGRLALDWMQAVVPAAGLAIQLLPLAPACECRPLWLVQGDCPINEMRFSQLVGHLTNGQPQRLLIANRSTTSRPDWPCPEVCQMIAVPLSESNDAVGWLVAINHVNGEEFSEVEAGLLASVASVLGIPGGANVDPCRQQSELLAGVVRALVAAIEDKDSYTCGHSDRVARVAVRLGEELGCDAKTTGILYLAGLLHDVGKIGVNNAILQKPSALSKAEYEHVKQHVRIGHHVLQGLNRLEEVLPVVLHHHEWWDGAGYPHHLESKRIPLAARIVAVADAYDAMTSDRPYRRGMSDDEADRILHEGSGKQWDPEVIDAFFRIRDEIRRIAGHPNPS